MEHEQAGLSIEQTVNVLRRRGLWILLCVVLVTGLAYGLLQAPNQEVHRDRCA